MTLDDITSMNKDRASAGGKGRSRYTVLVPIVDDVLGEWAIRVALIMARLQQGKVIVVGLVRVARGESLSKGATDAQARRLHLETLRSQFQDEALTIDSRIRVEHEPWREVVRLVNEEAVDMVVTPWGVGSFEEQFAVAVDEYISLLDCNVLLLGGGAPQNLKRILLPVRGSAEMPLVLKVGLALTDEMDARATILYSRGDDPSVESQRIYRETLRISRGHHRIEHEIQVDSGIRGAVNRVSAGYDLLIVGVSEKGVAGGGRVIGPTARHLYEEQGVPFIVVKTRQPAPLHNMSVWQSHLPVPVTPTSVLVDQWFAENTFSSDEFGEIERLVALKEEQQCTISLGLPALNEEKTVGTVIRTIRGALMEAMPLLDEIVLIDAGSTDATTSIAAELGVPVYQHSEILPQYGTFQGKGEGLWKSLYVLKGDLIAWIDTDIVNIHPRFVYGLLGPLLSRKTIHYVKGFYRRPLKVGNRMQVGGGGRVTELVARPLINLFYPELSGVVQPLAGEYAGRRAVLEQLPFYTGYGVETGLLLDLVDNYGISSIAQVDLRERVHHNQSLGALSRMSFAIIQVVIEHLERREKVELLEEMNRTMKTIQFGDSRYSLHEQVISDTMRPPMVTLKEYRDRHGKAEQVARRPLREVGGAEW